MIREDIGNARQQDEQRCTRQKTIDGQSIPTTSRGEHGGAGRGGGGGDTLSQINMLAVRLHALQMFAEAFAPNSPSKRLLKINDQPRRLLPEVSPGLRYFLGTS